ncbi:MAG: hypothetical protein ACKO24_19280 [Leptolyngbyaceae cyanobacterium]
MGHNPNHRTNLSITLAGLVGCLTTGLLLSGASAVQAGQDVYINSNSPAGGFAPVPNAFDEAYFENNKIFFRNRELDRQLGFIFGVPDFVENEITKDGQQVFDTYRAQMSAQLRSGPILRTPDLPTPFSYSLFTLPAPVSSPIGSPPIMGGPIAPVPPLTPPPLNRPVPSLW